MRALTTRFVAVALAVATVTLAGCATNRQYLADPVRNDALNDELARQSFRGRWWDLYERAFIYQKYELWALAEQDLRDALSVRNADQRWARSYGLHFIPEYFPNRELGIVLLQQDRIEEAMQYLDQSLGQQYTARAAHYADQAHEQRVKLAEADSESPSIEVLSPAREGVIGGTEVNVRAVVRDDTYVSEITVNGEPVPMRLAAREVPIERMVALAPGANTIAIAVTDIVGNRTEEKLQLELDSDGPAVSFDTPIAVPGTIRGVAYDPSDVKAIYIGDTQAKLTKGPDGETLFEFSLDGAPDRFVPEFRCEDGLGNATTGLLPIEGIRRQALRRDLVLASAAAVVPRDDEIVAVYARGELVGIIDTAVAAPTPGVPEIKFTNLFDGQRYYKDEVVVSLEVQSASAVRRVEINGQPINTIIPGRGDQRVSRRIRIEDEGAHNIVATVTDAAGNRNTVEASIERRLPQVEEVSARLSIALLGGLSKSQDPTLRDQAEYLRSELPFALDERGRFNVVDRDSIETVIEEQQLVAALGSIQERRRLGELDMADFLLIADLRRYADNVEILLHAVDSLTSREIVVDVYGPANQARQLRALIQDLALRLEQEFPRVRGNLTRVASNDRVYSSLSRSDRIQESMYCVIYRPQEIIDPKTNINLGTDLIPIAEGTLRDIQRDGSSIRLLLNNGEEVDINPQLTDLVVTK